MKIKLVRIGNSRGIRIPKPLIEQCGFGDTVDLRVEHDCLVIAPNRPPRHGWEKAFQKAGRTTEDQLLLDTIPPNEFDREEWQW
jgi:antitoxin MazE